MLEIIEDEKKEKAILRIKGRLDATSSATLEVKLSEGYSEGKRHFVLDLRNLEYLSSAGMRLFLAFTKKLKGENGSLKLFGLNKEIFEIIKMGGFEQILHIHDEEEEALQGD